MEPRIRILRAGKTQFPGGCPCPDDLHAMILARLAMPRSYRIGNIQLVPTRRAIDQSAQPRMLCQAILARGQSSGSLPPVARGGLAPGHRRLVPGPQQPVGLQATGTVRIRIVRTIKAEGCLLDLHIGRQFPEVKAQQRRGIVERPDGQIGFLPIAVIGPVGVDGGILGSLDRQQPRLARIAGDRRRQKIHQPVRCLPAHLARTLADIDPVSDY